MGLVPQARAEGARGPGVLGLWSLGALEPGEQGHGRSPLPACLRGCGGAHDGLVQLRELAIEDGHDQGAAAAAGGVRGALLSSSPV